MNAQSATVAGGLRRLGPPASLPDLADRVAERPVYLPATRWCGQLEDCTYSLTEAIVIGMIGMWSLPTSTA